MPVRTKRNGEQPPPLPGEERIYDEDGNLVVLSYTPPESADQVEVAALSQQPIVEAENGGVQIPASGFMPPAEATDPDPPVVFEEDGLQAERALVADILTTAPRGRRLAHARARGVQPGTLLDEMLREAMASELAPQLVGLSQRDAAGLVEHEPGLSIRFVPDGVPIPAIGIPGRITAWLHGTNVESTMPN